MILSSMTGFARASGTTGPVQWAWEVRSVNGRGLDVRLRVPNGFDAIGDVARTALQRTLSRGQCQVNLTLARPDVAPRIRINEALLASLAASIARVPLPPGMAPATLDGLLGIRGVIEADDEPGAEAETLSRDLSEGVVRLVADLIEARRAEGRQLREIIEGQLAAMEELTEAAEACPARKPEAVRARLAATVGALLQSGSFDGDRLHQEAVLMAAKADARSSRQPARSGGRRGRHRAQARFPRAGTWARGQYALRQGQ